MSIQAMAWVWEHSTAAGTELLVFLALADFADGEGECWPHQDKVAQKSRLSTRTVQRIIERLVASGELQAYRTGRGNRYKIPMRQSDVIRHSYDVSDTPSLSPEMRHSSVASDTTTVSLPMNRQEPSMNHQGNDASLGKSKASDRPPATWVRPTNFVEDLDQLPERQVDPITDETKAAAVERIRHLKAGEE